MGTIHTHMERQVENHEYHEAAAKLYKSFFVQQDCYAMQLPDGRYVSIKEPVTEALIVEHLKGVKTLGTYLLSSESRARFIVLDADESGGDRVLARLAQELTQEGTPSYLEGSRRGAHLWFFFGTEIAGHDARAFGQGILNSRRITNVELYPKQDKLHDGPGSLIRLPFGIHKRSQKRYPFMLPTGELLAPTIREQIQVLASHQTVSEAAISSYASYLPPSNEKPAFRVFENPTDSSAEDIKSRISVFQFVSQFIELRPTASGAVGNCPFHDDAHASFGVNTKKNYWHCFAGCGGGSIVDFWMKWRGIEFQEAASELHTLLGTPGNCHT